MKEKVFRSTESEAEVVSEKDRILRFRVSDETPDRAGDIVRQAGIDWSKWEKNPVILLAHDYSDFPVGKGVDHGRAQRGSWVDVKFASKDQYDRAEVAYQLAKPPDRYLNATSIGFIPMKTYSPENEKERKELNLGPFGVVFEKSELLEVSLVSVPANPNAVGMGIVKSAKDPFFEDWVGKTPKQSICTLTFSKEKFTTIESAKSWAAKRGFLCHEIVEDEKSISIWQFSVPSDNEGVCSSVLISDGVTASTYEEPNTKTTSVGEFIRLQAAVYTAEGPEILKRLSELEQKIAGVLTKDDAMKYFSEIRSLVSSYEEKKSAGRPGTVEPKAPAAVPPGADLYEQILGDLTRVSKRAARK